MHLMHHEWKIIPIFNVEGGSLSFLATGWGVRGSPSPSQAEHGPVAGGRQVQALEMGALQRGAAERPHRGPGTILAWEPHFPSALSGKEKPLCIYLSPCKGSWAGGSAHTAPTKADLCSEEWKGMKYLSYCRFTRDHTLTRFQSLVSTKIQPN